MDDGAGAGADRKPVRAQVPLGSGARAVLDRADRLLAAARRVVGDHTDVQNGVLKAITRCATRWSAGSWRASPSRGSPM